MGDWNTLHPFDDKKFFSEVIPKLKGEKPGIKGLYKNAVDGYFLSKNAISIDNMIEISQELQNGFTEYQPIKDIENSSYDVWLVYFNKNLWIEDYQRFF